MKTHVYVIAIIKKGDAVLMRKKPDGTGPYKEPWYLFGAEIDGNNQDSEKAVQDRVRGMAGIEIKMGDKLTWNTEAKADPDGNDAFYVYLDTMFEYVSGDLKPGEGIEKLEWIPVDKLRDYDLVPPSKKLLQRIGWL